MRYDKKLSFEFGFTLIELLVVISIIGLLASVVLVSLNSARTKAKAARAAADLRQIGTALSMYLDDNGIYPCHDHNWDDVKEKVWADKYLKWPQTPYGTHYHFETPASSWGGGWVGLMTYSISLQDVPLKDAQALANAINNGSLTSGILIQSGGTDPVRLEWGGMDQNVTFVDTHCL